MWYKLGVAAARLIYSTRSAEEKYAAQRSSLLGDAAAVLATLRGSIDASSAKELATWMEQGDPRIWDALQGQPLVAWAPSDASGLGRFVNAYLKAAADPH